MAHSTLSTRRVTSIRTYDPTDCTTIGWEVTLYTDGHLAAEKWSCWQGSTTGERWITDAGRVAVYGSALSSGRRGIYVDDVNLKADMRRALEVLDAGWDRYSYGWANPFGGWRSVRRGHVVR